jgi:hypothetical protein
LRWRLAGAKGRAGLWLESDKKESKKRSSAARSVRSFATERKLDPDWNVAIVPLDPARRALRSQRSAIARTVRELTSASVASWPALPVVQPPSPRAQGQAAESGSGLLSPRSGGDVALLSHR